MVSHNFSVHLGTFIYTFFFCHNGTETEKIINSHMRQSESNTHFFKNVNK